MLQDALFLCYKQSPDNAHSVAFSQRSSTLCLIEDETFNDSDIMNNLIDYEDGQEEPDSLRVDKNIQGSSFPTKWKSIFFNYIPIKKVAACHSTEMRKQIELCLKTDHSVMEAELYQELKNIRMEPVFCMTFMSVPLFTKFQEFFPSFGAIEHKGKKMKFSESITKLKHVHREVIECDFKEKRYTSVRPWSHKE
ncbi:uncharacterized protein TNCV_798871 [Trichonephila clavipes]|nr:uncharacterized protein TNCV_798871 [Trichonephila clavipes]